MLGYISCVLSFTPCVFFFFNNNNKLLSHSSRTRSLRSRRQQDWFLLRVVSKILFQASPLASGGIQTIFGISQLIEASPWSLPWYLSGVLPVWVSANPYPLFFYKNTSQIGLGPTLMTSFYYNLLISVKTLFPWRG